MLLKLERSCANLQYFSLCGRFVSSCCCTTGEEGGDTLLVQRVEELADAHRAYAQLFEVCQLQGDESKLHSIMMRHRATNSGNQLDLEQSAVAYVFDRYALHVASFGLELAGYCFLRS